MNRILSIFTLFFIFSAAASPLLAQSNAQITLGPDEIGENQGWTITLTVQNDRIKSYDNFPDIE